jgi:hypothetical protein
MTTKTIREIPEEYWNNGMTRQITVHDDGQTLEEVKTYFERKNPGHLISIRRGKLSGNRSVFIATIYN